VRRFPGPRELAALMDGCGLARIRYVLTAGGIIAIHVGEVA
jgi:demethylmenaquinone methyltransferase/2-methoxy-6-polyprenyl-1,4-benzoquinol methylase